MRWQAGLWSPKLTGRVLDLLCLVRLFWMLYNESALLYLKLLPDDQVAFFWQQVSLREPWFQPLTDCAVKQDYDGMMKVIETQVPDLSLSSVAGTCLGMLVFCYGVCSAD